MGKSLFSRTLLINMKQFEMLLGHQIKQLIQNQNSKPGGKEYQSLGASNNSLFDLQN